MTVELQRERTSPAGTFGRLAVNGVFLAFTLEPGDDEVHGPIPAGAYHVEITTSVRFQRRLPLVVSVPGRSGIRVHPGNVERDTAGCILLGYGRTADSLHESAAACTAFQHLIAHPLASGEIVPFVVRDAL